MKPGRAAVALALALACACAAAGEFGLPALGQSLPAGGSPDCRPTASPAEFVCPLAVPDGVAGIPVTEASARVQGSRVAGVTAFVREEDFGALVAALASRWGPGEAREEQLRAGMGATFTNTIRIWRRGDGVWFAEQFAGRITRSALMLTTPEALETLLEQREAATENGSRAL